MQSSLHGARHAHGCAQNAPRVVDGQIQVCITNSGCRWTDTSSARSTQACTTRGTDWWQMVRGMDWWQMVCTTHLGVQTGGYAISKECTGVHKTHTGCRWAGNGVHNKPRRTRRQQGAHGCARPVWMGGKWCAQHTSADTPSARSACRTASVRSSANSLLPT